MTPATRNFTLQQGASFVLKANLRDANNTKLDLSAYSAEMAIRESPDDDSAILTLTSSDSGPSIVLDTAAADFNLTVRISAAQTAALPTRFEEILNWGYDLKLWVTADPDYTTIVPLKGLIAVNPLNSR